MDDQSNQNSGGRQGSPGSSGPGASSGSGSSAGSSGGSGGAQPRERDDQGQGGIASQAIEGARTVVSGAGSAATGVARQARDGVAAASDAVYQGGSQAGQYLARGIDEYPVAALLVAGAIGYGLAYLIHSRWDLIQTRRE